ncbi:hypothetical protein EV578_120115 [Streptomyces sp. BK205]|nr:hypothetical protein EV578_120115 [Streptomyces sp. BK205]
MAAFVAMTSWKGEFTDAYFAQPPADPAAFGKPTEDDGSTAELLGQWVSVFPSHHGGFVDGEFGYAGEPDEFAHRLREVLDGPS